MSVVPAPGPGSLGGSGGGKEESSPSRLTQESPTLTYPLTMTSSRALAPHVSILFLRTRPPRNSQQWPPIRTYLESRDAAPGVQVPHPEGAQYSEDASGSGSHMHRPRE